MVDEERVAEASLMVLDPLDFRRRLAAALEAHLVLGDLLGAGASAAARRRAGRK